jgi:hypothetical protein
VVGSAPLNSDSADSSPGGTHPTEPSTNASIAQPATGTPAVAKPATPAARFDFPVANQPLVGVISTGFTANNPDIDYSRIALGQDRVAGDANPLMQPTEGSAPGTHVLGIIGATQGNNKGIDGINDDAPLWVGRAPATSEKWAESLKEFVDAAKQSAQPNAVVNINLNLTETTPQGQVVPRSQLNAAEKEALAYAQQNKVLVVVAAGNDPQQISALGNAGLDFDNIITVGSGNRTGQTDYSGTGEALDIVAEGGTRSNPVLSTVGTSTGNMAGTSVAAAQVTGAVSQVWAANPQLNYRQVVDIVKNTATDLGQPNWDAQTGAGLLNMEAAVKLAKVTAPFQPESELQPYPESDPVATEPVPLPGEADPVERAIVGDISQEINTELVPELGTVLTQLQSTLAEITANPSATQEPAPDAPTEQEQDDLISQLNAEIEAAFAELTEDKFADVSALAGKFEFAREAQPLVGVIDTGFAAKNPDIDKSRITAGKDYIDGDDNPLLAEGEGDDHGTKVLEVIAATQNNNVGIDGVNDDAPIWLGRAVGSGEWAKSLVDFVDAAKQSDQPNGVVNLSFDLTQRNPDGSVTTRTQFTQEEIDALKYARDNNVLVVVAAGNQGTAVMSALGQASEHFNNIITVGAADEAANRADYSSYGKGLDLMAYGARLDDPTTATGSPELDLFAGLSPEEIELVDKLAKQSDSSSDNMPALSEEEEAKAFAATQKMLQKTLDSLGDVGAGGDTDMGANAIAGTSIAAAKVTGAASQVWAANPDLNAAQVKEILKATAVDLHTPGWDMETGAGLLNLGLAVQAAFSTKGEAYAADSVEMLSGLGVLNGSGTPEERPTKGFWKKLWNGVKKVFNTVVTVVKKVVKVVQKVVNVAQQVVDFIQKAIPLFTKIGGFIRTIASKFVCLPILGKIGVVLGGIALVGAAVGGAIWWFNKQKQQQQQQQQQPEPQQQVVVVQEDPMVAKINALQTAWAKLSAQQKTDLKSYLLNGLPDKYKPLFNGAPDKISVLLSAVNSLTQEQQNQLGPKLLDGVPPTWKSFFDGTNPSNSYVPQAVKDAWNSLTVPPEQKEALKNALLNGVTSPYGRPIMEGDPDGILKVASVFNSPNLTEQDKDIIGNFLLNEPGGVPDQYHSLFF